MKTFGWKVFDDMNIGIFLLDENFRVTFVNKWTEKRFDPSFPLVPGNLMIDQETAPGRFVEALKVARDNGRSSLLSGKLNRLPFKLVHGGIELSFNLLISRVCEDQKDILVQIIDVTQVKQREQFLLDKQKEVDIIRAHSFTQERLVSLGELSSSIAHEINNPLAIIELSVRMIEKIATKKQLLFPELGVHIHEVGASIKRVNSLITSIKNLARNSNAEKVTSEPLNVIIQDVLPVLALRAKQEGIELRYDAEAEAFNVPIECMRALLGQVFVNILNNSFYEMRKFEQKWVEVDAKLNPDTIEIAITDSGAGIPATIREKIFLPFFTTKDIGEGTGLGLGTVLKIIDGHNGKIRIDSESPNTRFVISLPIRHTG